MFSRTNLILLGLLCGLLTAGVGPQSVLAQGLDQQRERVNAGTVGIISGGVTGTYVRIASDLSNALDDGYQHRVLALLGKGSIRNIEDLLLLKGIDIAIVQSDVLDFYLATQVFPNIENRIRYITKLYNEEVHLLARAGTSSVLELKGGKVNFGTKGSGTFMTASIVFESLNVDVDVTTFPEPVALDKLRKGEIDGLVFVGGKPLSLLADIGADENLALVEIPPQQVSGAYLASALSSSEYPNLVPAGGSVPTVAVGAVMAAYNWDPEHYRYRKTKRFVEQFFASFDTLRSTPYHPKWKEVDLRAEVPGWTRFKAAEDWLVKNK